jgi:hypothetical protein
MFGYGASASFSDFGHANDAAALGGLIGYNVGLAGTAALSTVWVPTYESLSWMWIGFGAGALVSLPVYLFYAGGDHDARRGLIFQGTAATLGLVAGAVFTIDAREFGANDEGPGGKSDVMAGEAGPKAPIRITGGGVVPVRGGFVAQVSGVLF